MKSGILLPRTLSARMGRTPVLPIRADLRLRCIIPLLTKKNEPWSLIGFRERGILLPLAQSPGRDVPLVLPVREIFV